MVWQDLRINWDSRAEKKEKKKRETSVLDLNNVPQSAQEDAPSLDEEANDRHEATVTANVTSKDVAMVDVNLFMCSVE